MRLNKKDLDLELEYLKQTLHAVDQMGGATGRSMMEKAKDVEDFKKYIWGAASDMDIAELASNMQLADLDSRRVESQHTVLKRLFRAKQSPYFGRLDFKDDEDGADRIYIGLMQITEDHAIYVYDWRAPISSMFYEFGVGRASYQAPIGEITGEITLRRQYKIENGKLIRCFDSDLNVLDDYLQEVLAQSSSSKLKHIVTTIQHEQNRIIRNTEDKYLIVQGVAGSGKTSVALHRIAYLLYKDKRLSSNNVLIFSPNSIFSEYITDVLPELGEENTLQTTFTDLAATYLKGVSKVESFTEFLERCYKNKSADETEHAATQYKLSDAFKQRIDEYVSLALNRVNFSNALTVFGMHFTAQQLTLMFRSCSGNTVADKSDRLADVVCDRAGVEFERDRNKIHKLICNQLEQVLEIKSVYLALLDYVAVEDVPSIRNFQNAFITRKELQYEDCIALLYLKFALFGFTTDAKVMHVVIDEVQDYNLMQLRILAGVFTSANFTLLGDVNQAINRFYKHKTLDVIGEVFHGKSKYIELTKAYRSTQEIINFTNNIAGIHNVSAMRHKANQPVRLKSVSCVDTAEMIRSEIRAMSERGLKSIAIITKNDDQALKLHDEMHSYFPELVYIGKKTSGFSKKLIVIPSYIAKGLEFDGVIAYVDKHAFYSESEKGLYYVVCTRAQHELVILQTE
jgi:DNA helicase-2/ATP-dependent DNA helicase PcrA